MALPQLAVMAVMFHWLHPVTAAIVGFLVIAQLFLMQWLLEKPRERAPLYNATGTSLYVTGMLICAFALAHA
jgi:chlorophyll synthase